jgi:glycosyltransferase involved in cell wall biosynthesis
MYTLVFDGAPLVWRPNSPAALHLLTLLDRRPKGARTLLALPGRPLFPLPDDIQSMQVNTPAGESGALAWEQRLLPRLAREQQADFLHLTGKNVPLFGQSMTVLSPTAPARSTIPDSRRNMGQRLRLAFGQGGRARLKAIFWPADLPLPEQNQRIVGLPPCVPPSFTEAALAPDLELPDEFILFHGMLDERTLQRLLSSWSWAAAAIGETTSLLILGADALQIKQIEQLARQNSLSDSVIVSPLLPVEGLAWLYQHCRAVFHPAAIGPWGSSMRLALACGRPLVGWETPLADALVGPAAYLVPGEPEDAALNRALGAALITVIVEESVAMKLEEAARQRSAAWGTQDFRARLDAAYQDLLGSRN